MAPAAPAAAGWEEPDQVTPCVNGYRWPHRELTFSYGGSHRYYGNAWQAVANWNQLSVFKITPAPKGQKASIVFTDVNKRSLGYYASTLGVGTSSYTQYPAIYLTPTTVNIVVNRPFMDGLDDSHRTFALMHELGHALGLAHTDEGCGLTNPSIMKAGSGDITGRVPLTIQAYDVQNLDQLYPQ